MRPKLFIESYLEIFPDMVFLPKNVIKDLPFKNKLEFVGQHFFETACKEPAMLETFDYMSLFSKFLIDVAKGTSSVYRMANKFGGHLDRTNLKIPCSVLPILNKIYGVEFHKPMTNKKSKWMYNTVLIATGVQKIVVQDTLFTIGVTNHHRGVIFVFPRFSNAGEFHDFVQVSLDVDHDTPIDNMVLENTDNTDEDVDFIAGLVAYATKCLLYIESGDPDLQTETPKPLLTKNPKKVKRHHRNHIPIEVVNVGYGFHGKLYSVEEASVSGHFRWQPYGPGLTKVKLIWIDEHIRQYKNNNSLQA